MVAPQLAQTIESARGRKGEMPNQSQARELRLVASRWADGVRNTRSVRGVTLVGGLTGLKPLRYTYTPAVSTLSRRSISPPSSPCACCCACMAPAVGRREA